MNIAYFDTFSGVSGDMTLGAFVSAGMPVDVLRDEIAKLRLKGVEIEAKHLVRNGMTAVKVDVVISAKQTHHRHLRDILEIIDGSSLSARVKSDARLIFEEVARAEAIVHNTTVEKIHFHEVGALDSIVDIVGAAICLEYFGIDIVYSSPVRLGSGGFIDTEHGKLPLPGPAVCEILRDYPSVLTEIPYELTTPTGAAIIKSKSAGILSSETFVVRHVGYGAGTREIPNVPNLLRIMIGELREKLDTDEPVLIETNIDDMNPELYPYIIELALKAGANDAFLTPVIMKKGRPGVILSVLTDQSKRDAMCELLFSQTSSIGVRIIRTERRKLPRESREVETRFGRLRCKVVTIQGKEKMIPEFEECRRVAESRNLPLIEVYRELEREFAT